MLKYYFIASIVFWAFKVEGQRTEAVKSVVGTGVIHSSDFASPPGDPDDHFDMLTLFASKNIDIKAVLPDHPNTVPGRSPNYNGVKQVVRIFGRPEVPTETGLRFKELSSPDDAGYYKSMFGFLHQQFKS